jgi:penicillin V acylase-like amidase (Ntn superfamily)
MCTRVLYVGLDALVITGRSMDWMTATGSNIWSLPSGLPRDGAAQLNPFSWRSQHGSVISSMYDGVTVDGVNDAGLGANALYLSAAHYPTRDPSIPGLSVAAWTQYALDMFATVAEAVESLSDPPFQVVSPVLPGGHAATGHLALSDATGDSAIFEYLDGQLVVHHGSEYVVMTNDPTYEQQLALCTYWDEVGGSAMLPGTERPADRFVRAHYYLDGLAPTSDLTRGIADVFGIVRNASVPAIRSTPEKPNVAPTLWRSAIDHRSLTYFWESTSQPNIFWVELDKLDLSVGASPARLTAEDGPIRSGEVSGAFAASEPFAFLPEVV